jgi:hypothetical protein
MLSLESPAAPADLTTVRAGYGDKGHETSGSGPDCARPGAVASVTP